MYENATACQPTIMDVCLKLHELTGNAKDAAKRIDSKLFGASPISVEKLCGPCVPAQAAPFIEDVLQSTRIMLEELNKRLEDVSNRL